MSRELFLSMGKERLSDKKSNFGAIEYFFIKISEFY